MLFFISKIIIASTIISFCSWLSGKRPELAGYIIALPLGTILTLTFSHIQYGNPDILIRLTRSILAAIPMSLLFFIPFAFYRSFFNSFWMNLSTGIIFIFIGYGIHTWIFSHFKN